MKTSIENRNLRKLIREAVREVLSESWWDTEEEKEKRKKEREEIRSDKELKQHKDPHVLFQWRGYNYKDDEVMFQSVKTSDGEWWQREIDDSLWGRVGNVLNTKHANVSKWRKVGMHPKPGIKPVRKLSNDEIKTMFDRPAKWGILDTK